MCAKMRLGFASAHLSIALTIQLNGDRVEMPGPLTVSELLARFAIDARRVAVEHNLVVLKRAMLDGMAPLVAPVPVEVEVTTARTWGGD